MGQLLHSQELVPDQILCSSARRARQTADEVAKVLGRDIEVIEDLYLASVPTWEKVLKTHARSGLVLAIAHNPGIEEFVNRVSGKYQAMPTAAIAWFNVSEPQAGFSFANLVLQTVWRPKELDGNGSHDSQ